MVSLCSLLSQASSHTFSHRVGFSRPGPDNPWPAVISNTQLGQVWDQHFSRADVSVSDEEEDFTCGIHGDIHAEFVSILGKASDYGHFQGLPGGKVI